MTVLVKGLCPGAERGEVADEEGTLALVLRAFYLVESRDKGSVTSQCLSSSFVETGLGKAVSGAASGACVSNPWTPASASLAGRVCTGGRGQVVRNKAGDGVVSSACDSGHSSRDGQTQCPQRHWPVLQELHQLVQTHA